MMFASRFVGGVINSTRDTHPYRGGQLLELSIHTWIWMLPDVLFRVDVKCVTWYIVTGTELVI